MARAEAPEAAPDPTAAAEAAQLELPPEIAAQSLGEWLRAWATRIRSGDSGVLPVILGFAVIMVVFQAISPNGVFLSANNIVNLFQQSAVFMVLAMGEIFILLLGEIDLSIGYADHDRQTVEHREIVTNERFDDVRGVADDRSSDQAHATDRVITNPAGRHYTTG